MPETISNNKRIAKNALMLYIRMFLTMIVGLYTSRVVLSTLGVEDYGIYGVVGGVVAMMGFLNASMSGATSRFLTFELGRGELKRVSDTFSSALIIHLGLAAVVFVIAETIGLWFLCNKLVIPEGRMTAAHWVYQCSILSAMIGFTQAPYNASIIAHEKMDVYAYVEILNVTLKLLIVYLLVIGHFDKLILYAILHLAVTVLVRMVYRLYCIHRFPETHFHWVWDKSILKPMLSFSGWNLYGNFCVMVRQQGTNFLINIFFGVAFNAASSVATTLQGIIKSFTYNTTAAFRPQIIKSYSVGKYNDMQRLLKVSFSMAIFLSLLISLPLYLEMNYLMKFWLGKPPAMASTFAELLVISAIFAMMTLIFTIGIEATGYNRQLNVYTGTIYMLTIPVMYILFKLGCGVQFAYYCIIGANALIFTSNMLILKHLVPQIKIKAMIWILFKSVISAAIAVAPALYLKSVFDESFLRLAITTIVVEILFISISYRIILEEASRDVIKKKFFSVLRLISN